MFKVKFSLFSSTGGGGGVGALTGRVRVTSAVVVQLMELASLNIDKVLAIKVLKSHSNAKSLAFYQLQTKKPKLPGLVSLEHLNHVVAEGDARFSGSFEIDI